MKKKFIGWKKAAALFLSAVLVAAIGGCGSTEGIPQGSEDGDKGQSGTKAMGRYMESLQQITEKDGPSWPEHMVRMEDGSLAMLDMVNGQYVSRDNGATWENIPLPFLSELSAGAYISSADLSPLGDIALTYVSYDAAEGEGENGGQDEKSGVREMTDIQFQYMLLRQDGTRLPFGENMSSSINYTFSDTGDLYFTGEKGKIYRMNPETGESELVLETAEECSYLNVFQNTLLTANASEIAVYDLESQKRIEDQVLSDFFANEIGGFASFGGEFFSAAGKFSTPLIYQQKDGLIYIACDSGLYRHVLGGSTVEQVMDGALNSFSDPSVSFLDMIWVSEDSFQVLFTGGVLASYRFDPKMATVPEIRISAYSLERNSVMQQAIALFQQEHPEAYVEYEIGLEEGASMTKEDALKNLNTRILSGDGPDILLLDEMPIRSYLQKGVLADLSSVLKEIKQEEELLSIAENTYRDGEKIYAVPLKFMVPTIIGDKEKLGRPGSLKEFADSIEAIRKEQPDGQILGLYLEEQVLAKLGTACAPIWEKEDGSINREAVTEFLIQAKRIYESEIAGVLPEEIETYRSMDNSSNLSVGSAGKKVTDQWELAEDMSSTVLEFANGECSVAVGRLQQSFGFAGVISAMEAAGNPNFTLEPLSLDGKRYYLPNHILGILSSSPNQEMAGELIKLMLGQRVPSDLSGGFPVNRKLFEDTFINPNKEERGIGQVASEGIDGKSLTMDINWPLEADVNRYQDILEAADTPDLTDSVLKETVLEVGTSALSGEKTVEEAVDEIISRLAIYLAE